MITAPGSVDWQPALDRPELLAAPVLERLTELAATGAIDPNDVLAGPIDDTLADTAEFCAHYGVTPAESANCVIVAGKRAGETSYAACMLLADTRLDVNGVVRAELGARKASFAPRDAATDGTGMEYGGVTPIGVPGWPVLIDARISGTGVVIIGSGLRASKIATTGAVLSALPDARVIVDLAKPVE